MPDTVLADHLLGGVHGISTTRATSALWGLRTGVGIRFTQDSSFATGADQGGGMAVTESLGSEKLAVAGSAVDLTVRAIAGQHRVKWTMAFRAVEALLVPHRSLGELLLSSKHHASTAGTSLARRSLDGSRIGVVEGSVLRNLILG